MADHHGHSAAIALGDVGQAAYRAVSYDGQWLDARCVIDRAPPGSYCLPVGARPLPVVAVEQALVGRHLQAGLAGNWLCGLPGPKERAGDDGGQHPGAQRRCEAPGLLMPGLIERRVEQPPQDAGLAEQCLAMPGKVDQGCGRLALLPHPVF
jgi:hypothetical protein